VSIVVPFRDEADLLAACVASVERTAGWEPRELVLVDNRSWQPETLALERRLRGAGRTLLAYDAEFNWSALNNWAAARSGGELLLFLNDDVEGLSSGWLAAMVEHALRAEVGAVGARLLYPGGGVQHAGVFLGARGGAGHAFRHCPVGSAGYLGLAKVVRNWSAVTGACLLTSRAVFEEVGGFDERLPLAFNDVDYCLRLRDRGYRIVYTPFAELWHDESLTRGMSSTAAEAAEVRRRWAGVVDDDPHYHPALSRRREDFSLRWRDAR
jgi:GT2 family glycosyltransferase